VEKPFACVKLNLDGTSRSISLRYDVLTRLFFSCCLGFMAHTADGEVASH